MSSELDLHVLKMSHFNEQYTGVLKLVRNPCVFWAVQEIYITGDIIWRIERLIITFPVHEAFY